MPVLIWPIACHCIYMQDQLPPSADSLLAPELGHGRNSPAIQAAAPHGARVLYVEDDDVLRELCRLVLNRAGFCVVTAVDGLDAWAAMQTQDFDLIITDHNMPRCTGHELISRIRAAGIHVPILVTTSCTERFSGDECEALRIAGVLDKPFSPRLLQNAAIAALWGIGAAAA